MRDDQIIPSLEDRSFWKFFEERRWCREFRGEYGPGKQISTIESKFRTGEASITLETLKQEWPTWTDEERGDFIGAFIGDARSYTIEFFRFFISLATPHDRYRYGDICQMAADPNEGFHVISEWLKDPATTNRRCLFMAVVPLAQHIGKQKVVSLLEGILDQCLANGQFWQEVETHSVSYERAREVTECLAGLGWLGNGAKIVPMLERIANADIKIISDRARELVDSSKRGQWSLTA